MKNELKNKGICFRGNKKSASTNILEEAPRRNESLASMNAVFPVPPHSQDGCSNHRQRIRSASNHRLDQLQAGQLSKLIGNKRGDLCKDHNIPFFAYNNIPNKSICQAIKYGSITSCLLLFFIFSPFVFTPKTVFAATGSTQSASETIGTSFILLEPDAGAPDWLFIENDSSVPVISNVTEKLIDTTTLQVSWKTDVPSTSLVEYATPAEYNSDRYPFPNFVEDKTYVTNHILTVKNLSQNSGYYYEVRSNVNELREAVSDVQTIGTIPAIPSPSVSPISQIPAISLQSTLPPKTGLAKFWSNIVSGTEYAYTNIVTTVSLLINRTSNTVNNTAPSPIQSPIQTTPATTYSNTPTPIHTPTNPAPTTSSISIPTTTIIPSVSPIHSISSTPIITSIPTPIQTPVSSPSPSQTPIQASPTTVSSPSPIPTGTPVQTPAPTPTITATPTVTPSPSTEPAPAALLTVQGVHNYAFDIGDTVTYRWNSSNADIFQATYTSNNTTACGPGGDWSVANNSRSGFVSSTMQPGAAGCYWTVVYKVTNSKTGEWASDTITVKVNPQPVPSGSPSPSPQAAIPRDWFTANILNAINTLNFTNQKSDWLRNIK